MASFLPQQCKRSRLIERTGVCAQGCNNTDMQRDSATRNREDVSAQAQQHNDVFT